MIGELMADRHKVVGGTNRFVLPFTNQAKAENDGLESRLSPADLDLRSFGARQLVTVPNGYDHSLFDLFHSNELSRQIPKPTRTIPTSRRAVTGVGLARVDLG